MLSAIVQSLYKSKDSNTGYPMVVWRGAALEAHVSDRTQ